MVPQARKKAVNNQNTARNGRSFLRRTKRLRAQAMARSAAPTARSDMTGSEPRSEGHEPKSQSRGKPDVPNSLVNKSTCRSVLGRFSERFNAPRRAYSYGAAVDPRRPAARTQTINSQRPELATYHRTPTGHPILAK